MMSSEEANFEAPDDAVIPWRYVVQEAEPGQDWRPVAGGLFASRGEAMNFAAVHAHEQEGRVAVRVKDVFTGSASTWPGVWEGRPTT